MNKLQSFLTQELDQMQAVEPDEQRKIDGGCAPTVGPNGTIIRGDIGPTTIKTGPVVHAQDITITKTTDTASPLLFRM